MQEKYWEKDLKNQVKCKCIFTFATYVFVMSNEEIMLTCVLQLKLAFFNFSL